VTGRSFEIVKTQTMRPVYIIPSSGMTLELAGRTAVGTVTMAQSLQAGAVITKVDYNRFSVVGNNLS
jgi:alkanesulfonate monooxygenase SsuD/methylene tetrahydromethanopterin reductase-like flavin-dependent oxidoreductase (luciferase family)